MHTAEYRAPSGPTCQVSRSVFEGAAPPHRFVRNASRGARETGWLLTGETDGIGELYKPGNILNVDVAWVRQRVPEFQTIEGLPIGSRAEVASGPDGSRTLDLRFGLALGAATRGYPYPYGPGSFDWTASSRDEPARRARHGALRSGLCVTGLVLALLGALLFFGLIVELNRSAVPGAAIPAGPIIEIGVLAGVPLLTGLVLLITYGVLARRRRPQRDRAGDGDLGP